MRYYHGTTKEAKQKILDEGFKEEYMGKNGLHLGRAVYLTTTKKRASVYGKALVEFEIADVRLKIFKDKWLSEYKQLCEKLYASGVPANEVNTKAGEYIRDLTIKEGYDGILILPLMGGYAKELVLYNLGKIKGVKGA